MVKTVKAIVHDFDILSSKGGAGEIVLYLKHPKEEKIMEYKLPHMLAVNKILEDAKLLSAKQLIGKAVELTVSGEEEVQWKNMA